MIFNYQARTKEGDVRMGVIEASSQEVAISILQKQGLYLTLLEETQKKPFYARKIKLFESVSKKDIVIFSRQLSILFRSQVPLVEALETMALQTKNPFREKIMDLAQEVQGGSSFSQALSKYPKIFSPLYIGMVKSGEAAGKLSESLLYLADHSEREHRLDSKIKGAMIYPAFILGTLLLVGVVMVYYVLPNLIKVLEETGAELPLLTKIVIGFTSFLKTKGYFAVPPIIILVFVIRRYIQTKAGRDFFDKLFLKMPVFGNFIKLTNITRFAENLSTLISGGLPIGRALEITQDVVGNGLYKKMIFDIQEAVKRGETISSVLEKNKEIVPPLIIQMTIVGERTGQLDSALKNAVDFYQKELEASVDKMLGLIEPILLLFLGIVVGVFVAAIMFPIYNMGGGVD